MRNLARTPLALRNLTHNPFRCLIAVVGVAISVVLMFMQFGFLRAVEDTATVLYEKLEYDIALRSPDYLHVAEAGTISRDALLVAASLEGVAEVKPFYVAPHLWTLPEQQRARAILVMGVDPAAPAFRLEEVKDQASRLTTAGSVLIDRKSRKEFSPRDLLPGMRGIGEADVGREAELGGHGVRIVGHFEMGIGLAADGAVLMNPQGFARVFPGLGRDRVSIGLVSVTDRRQTAAIAQRLRSQLPADVSVLTRSEVEQVERRRWLAETPIGTILSAGVYLALVVGMAIVYQVLATDVARHNRQYATLKGIGYTGGFLVRVILMQSVYLSVMAYTAAVAAVVLLYRVTSYYANLSITLNAGRMLIVFALALGMCAASGWLASRKVRQADPAELF